MKKIILTLIITLLSVFLMSTASFGASGDYTVDKVSYTADLRSDGSALITEEWTVTFSESGADGFGRQIAVIDDNFERITGVSDISVSADGNSLSEENTDSAKQGTYTLTTMSDSYYVSWNMLSAGETHVFSLRYVMTSAVKLYNEKAYFYCRAVNEGSNQLCRNVTLTVNAPADCFPEDFEILDSGSLAGEKSDGKVTFSAVNTAGLVRVGVSMPQSLFDTGSLTLIARDNTAQTAILIALSVIATIALTAVIYLAVCYKKVFRKYWEKKCGRAIHEESSYKAQSSVLKRISPADILYTLMDKPVNGADFFIITALDLVKRGYISAKSDGFFASEESDGDMYGRPLSENEKRVIKIFGSGRWKTFIEDPPRFHKEIETFNKKVRFISPLFMLSKGGRKLILRCFEMKLSAKSHEIISPAEISDGFFGNGKYTVYDLIISVINEYENGTEKDTSRFKRNFFMFRDV